MRSTLVIIGSALLVGVAFAIFLLVQAVPAARTGVAIVPIPTSAPVFPIKEGAQLHAGDNVWMKSGDGNMQFRADNYNPHPDGTIDMIQPQIEFFLGGGSMLRIDGETGFVVSPNATSGKVQGQSMEPKRGKMEHVILKMFQHATDTVPQFTCWLNNVAFDNETFRIATEECDIPDANGQLVHTPADEVPVHVIGIDYDFDGRGLYIKWDERDRKLQRLEIAHGEQLTIKHPSQAGGKGEPVSENDDRRGVPALAGTEGHPILVPGESGTPRRMEPEAYSLMDDGVPIALASADPSAAVGVAAAATTAPRKRSATTRVVHPPRKRPVTKPATMPTSAPVIHRTKEASPYRATFYDNVHVTQIGVTLATADRMNADFYMGSGGSSTKPSTGESTTSPTTAGSGSTARRSNSKYNANSGPGPVTQPVTRPVTRPTSKPSTRVSSTQPEEPPIIVRWTGKLIVIPPPADAPALSIGDTALEFIGDLVPAVLDRAGSIIHCASFRYQSLHRIVQLRNSPAIPIVTIETNDGTHIFCPSLNFDGFNHTADIPGPAHAEFKIVNEDAGPTTGPSTRPTSTALVDWSDTCGLQLAEDEHAALRIKEAVLDGDVHVDHPQIKLISDELDLGFDAATKTPSSTQSTTGPTTEAATQPRSTQPTSNPSTKPAGQSAVLRKMEANGNVDCTMLDTQGKAQHITSEHLTLDTAKNSRGGFDPSLVTADGDVHAFDDTQALSSGHLVASLEPSTRPVALAATQPTTSPTRGRSGTDLQLRELTAQNDVHFRTISGDFAEAEKLHVGVSQDIDLFGEPTASVGDKDTTITGPIIRYDPIDKQARVIGAGTLHSLSSGTTDRSTSKPAASTRPIDIAWNDGLVMNGMTNLINITGGVHTKSVSADGTVNTADGDHIVMTLIDAPATQPATRPSTKPSTQLAATTPAVATTKPSGMLGGSQSNFMKDKAVTLISLLGKGTDNVEVQSRLLDPQGKLLRSMNLYAPIVNYDKLSDSVVVPTPGRMLVQDFRNATTKPATKPAKADAEKENNAPGSGGMKGTTAFEWQKDLVYDQHADTATMTGNVHIVHQGDTAASGYEMFADQVVTDIDSSKPTTRPATNAAATQTTATASTKPDDSDSLKIKRITARGAVRMNSTRMNFQAAEVVYDPQTQIMIARGTPHEPAILLDPTGLSTGTFDELIYNTKTDDVLLRNSHTFLRR